MLWASGAEVLKSGTIQKAQYKQFRTWGATFSYIWKIQWWRDCNLPLDFGEGACCLGGNYIKQFIYQKTVDVSVQEWTEQKSV